MAADQARSRAPNLINRFFDRTVAGMNTIPGAIEIVGDPERARGMING